jgi:Na+/H+ antiporter NhaD/arsenite permease-like protein
VPTTVLAVFGMVYLGMFLGRLPRLRLDRTGVALLGAIALLAAGDVSLERARDALDVPTLALLFGLMVVSAQLRLGGFYSRVARALAELRAGPPALLAGMLAAAGGLSAVFSNDVVCLAMAPVWIDACRRRGLDPRPFLVGLACASNVGSAATLIGNPQNMLIGQALGLSFGGYLATAAGPAALGLVATWTVLVVQHRGRFAAAPGPAPAPAAPVPRFDRWQTAKGLAVAGALLAAFLGTSWPRELVALVGAGVLLTSRRMHSREMLGLVDWQLLVLFAGLFVVNDAFARTGVLDAAVADAARRGLALAEPAWLFGVTVALSNAVSNVPAVMLLLPYATDPLAGPVLALASTLAGNLLLVGSVANLIVAEAASAAGVPFDWRTHVRTGAPVTAASLLLAAAWLALAGP